MTYEESSRRMRPEEWFQRDYSDLLVIYWRDSCITMEHNPTEELEEPSWPTPSSHSKRRQ